MACYFKSNGKSRKLVVKSFSAPITASTGSTQLRRYSAPYSTYVVQDSISMTIQTKSREDYLSLASLLRDAQIQALNHEKLSSIIWPERRIAYEVYPKSIPVSVSYQDVAPVMQITFGIYRDMATTGLASVTNQEGSQKVIEDYISTEYSDIAGNPEGSGYSNGLSIGTGNGFATLY